MSEKKVRVAIIGVGNCASSLVQGVHYYRNAADEDRDVHVILLRAEGRAFCAGQDLADRPLAELDGIRIGHARNRS